MSKNGACYLPFTTTDPFIPSHIDSRLVTFDIHLNVRKGKYNEKLITSGKSWTDEDINDFILFYMIPGYRSPWLISYTGYTANLAQKPEILINRLMASAIFHGFFK